MVARLGNHLARTDNHVLVLVLFTYSRSSFAGARASRVCVYIFVCECASVFGLTDSGIHAIHTLSLAVLVYVRALAASSIIFIKESTAASYSSSRSRSPERSKPARKNQTKDTYI